MMRRWTPADTAARFEALWESGLLQWRGDPELEAVLSVVTASGRPTATALVALQGPRRRCVVRDRTLPEQWSGADAPTGWHRVGHVPIQSPDGQTIGELASFSRRRRHVPRGQVQLLTALGAMVNRLIAGRHSDGCRAGGVVVIDASGLVLSTSACIETELGWSADTHVGENFFMLVHPDDAPKAAQHFLDCTRSPGSTESMPLRLRGGGGEWTAVSVVAHNYLDDPSVGAVLLHVVPRERRPFTGSDPAGPADILGQIAAGAPVTTVANAVTAMVESQIAGVHCSVEAPDDVDTGAERCESGWTRDCYSGWTVPVCRDVNGQAVAVFRVVPTDPRLPHKDECQILDLAAQLLGVASEVHLAEARRMHQATHDGLTGLPNREVLATSLDTPTEAGAGAKVLLLAELTGIDEVYRSFGQEVGDEFLREASVRLTSGLDADDIVHRVGDRKFAVVLGPQGAGSATDDVAKQLIASVAEEPFTVCGRTACFSLDVGTTVSDSPLNRRMLEAEVALAEARDRRGPAVVSFDAGMLGGMPGQLELEAELRRGMRRDEFVPFYQPKIDLETGSVTGAEALLRWKHPGRGLLPPAGVVDVLERTGGIVPVGRRILELACRDASGWSERHDGQPLTVAVNVAVPQVEDPTLPDIVLAACRDANLEPSRLVLEITETVLGRYDDRALAVLDQLRGAGVRVSIDDFGTGYSSLARLAMLPVDEIKIDRRFVSGIRDAQKQRSLLAAMISMAHGLGLRTVAEGVETEEQANLLRNLGCDQAQGFLFGRPAENHDELFGASMTI